MENISLLRPNRFTIDLHVIGENTAALRKLATSPVKFFATIKADAYGFGLIPVARTVLAAGADALSVVRLEDAVALREAGIRCPILLYAGQVLGAEQVGAIETYDLWPAVHHRHALEALDRHLTRPIDCALKIECGQERLGVQAEEAAAFSAAMLATGKLRIKVVHTHPHVEGDADHLQWQFDRFIRAWQAVSNQMTALPPIAVFAGTKALSMRPDMMLTGIDPGQALFRLPAALASSPGSPPTPFHSLTSKLIHVYEVKRDEFLTQSLVPTALGSRVGIVPIGYGDGMTRLHAREVLIHGRRARVITPLSVEYTRIDLTGMPDAQVGDEVAFVGRQEDACISPDEVMAHAGVPRVTDLVIPLGLAVPRHYLPYQPGVPISQSSSMAASQ
ncbi:alanine racemase [Xanthomonas axonopodis]|uniref:alanine racemase n=1 Tax=Xanthomonas axonopodis TaxID=53413 RepID=UPI003555E4EB